MYKLTITIDHPDNVETHTIESTCLLFKIFSGNETLWSELDRLINGSCDGCKIFFNERLGPKAAIIAGLLSEYDTPCRNEQHFYTAITGYLKNQSGTIQKEYTNYIYAEIELTVTDNLSVINDLVDMIDWIDEH